MGSARFPITGRFSVDGKSTNRVARAGTNSLTVELALALNGDDLITGRVGGGDRAAERQLGIGLIAKGWLPRP